MNTRRPQKFTLSIGDIARRTGLTMSALRFHEKKALIGSRRTPGDQRCYTRDMTRRVSFIRAAQRVGLSLEEARTVLADLPTGRTRTREDWDQLGRAVQERELVGLAIAILDTAAYAQMNDCNRWNSPTFFGDATLC